MILYGLLFSLLGAIATGAYGYYKGYTICSQTYQSAALRAEIKRLTISNAYFKSSAEAATQASKENYEMLQENEKIIENLNRDIENEKAKNSIKRDCIIDRAFLQSTDSLK